MSNPLNIVKELGDYALHQQQAADKMRDEALRMEIAANALRVSAEEADRRSAEALADAAAIRDRRRGAQAAAFATGITGVTYVAPLGTPFTPERLADFSRRISTP